MGTRGVLSTSQYENQKSRWENIMRRFFSYQSAVSRVLTWVFLACLVGDAANLCDLIPDNIVLHDDDEMYVDVQPSVQPEVGSTQECSPHLVFSAVSPPVVRHYIYDQDSPSFAASTSFEGRTSSIVPAVKNIHYETPISFRTLHLLLCTLQI